MTTTSRGGSHKVHDLREHPNTTKSPHSQQSKLMIIIVTLESALTQKYTRVISKILESNLNGKVRRPAISYDDTDVQVNQITVTFAAVIASTTY